MEYHAKEIFRDFAAYNERANRELFEALARLTDRARKRDCGSWFDSIHGILNHLIVGDLQWLKRFRALSPDSPVLGDSRLSPPGLSWEHDLHDDLEALVDDRRYVDARLRDWFEEFPEERYGESFEYLDSHGTPRPAVAARAFEFLFLHQMHHRAQISQVLDELGAPNNIADNISFLEGEAQ